MNLDLTLSLERGALRRVVPGFAKSMFEVARNYAKVRSDDPKTRVGVVLLDENKGVTECNRLSPGVKPSEERLTAPLKYHYIEHAERNAIAEGQRRWGSVAGMEMYLPWFPCSDCARAIVAAGIAELYCIEPTDFDHHRWGEGWRAAIEILRAGKVEVFYVEGEEAP